MKIRFLCIVLLPGANIYAQTNEAVTGGKPPNQVFISDVNAAAF